MKLYGFMPFDGFAFNYSKWNSTCMHRPHDAFRVALRLHPDHQLQEPEAYFRVHHLEAFASTMAWGHAMIFKFISTHCAIPGNVNADR